MKKSVKILSILIFMSANLFAQYTLDWLNPCGVFNKIGVMSAKDNLDNLIVTGYYQSENMYTRKYDIGGNFMWEAVDSSGVQSMYEKPIWINSDSSNNIYVVGKRYSIGSGWEYPDAIVAVKYNATGLLLWRQTIPISTLIGSQHPGFNLRSEVDANSNLYIGTTAAVPSGFVFIKIDSSGNVLFVNNNAANAPNGFGSMRLKNNSVVMTGGGAGPVLAWDTAGGVLWTKSVAGAGYDIEMDIDKNVYLLSALSNQVSPTSGQDIVLYKLDSNGNQLWKRDFDFDGSDFPTRFTLVANKISAIGWGPNNSSGSPYFNWKVFQTDTSGTMLWSGDYNGTNYNDEYPYNLVAKPNGQVIVTGIGGPSPLPQQSLSYIQMVNVEYSTTGSKLWVDTPNIYGGTGQACMLASDGSLFVSSYYNMTAYHYNAIPAGLSDTEIDNNQSINIYPNPLSSSSTFEFNLLESREITLSIIDVMGREIKSISGINLQSGKSKIIIDLSELNNGVYFCKTNLSFEIIKLVKK